MSGHFYLLFVPDYLQQVDRHRELVTKNTGHKGSAKRTRDQSQGVQVEDTCARRRVCLFVRAESPRICIIIIKLSQNGFAASMN